MEKKKKILIIEDDSILQKAMQEFLTADGFEVFTASDGEEGLRFARSKDPDLILLDIILPKINGFEVLKEIKSDANIQKVPTILLTNLGGLNDVEKALALGASTYLVKSDYGLGEISQKVRETLAI
jgi:DNA-binding response OmpR family regulator